MKFRISTVLILLGIFVSAAQAQSNCCQIQLGGVQISGANTGRIAYDVFFVELAPVNTATCPVPNNKVGMLAPVSSLR